jgi:serine/threonine-protein kinase
MRAVTSPNEEAYRFDRFQIDAVKRVLLRDGEIVRLTSKRFDILLTLVRNSPRVVDKDELMSAVWPDTVVEESNLTHNISALRRALGESPEEHRFIVTIPGQGYRFVASVSQAPSEDDQEIVYERTRTRTRSSLVIEEEAGANEAVSHALEGGLNAMSASGYNATDVIALPEEPRAIEISPVGQTRRAWWSETRTLAMALALVLALIAIGLMVYLLRPGSVGEAVRSMAVLPFKPLVADTHDESLEMGMADTLIAKLSNIREINVRPISAVRKYAGLEQDAVAAGREQKVDAVVDGQIQKSGEKIRVTVRLVRIADGAQLWAAQFDERLTDIFRVQDAISERVAAALAVKLTGEEKQRLVKRHTENTEAYELYLKGRYHLNRLTDEGTLKSLEYFQQAAEKDSNFALVHAGLAESYNELGGFNVLRPREVYPKARSAAVMALKLDDLLPQAHAALAMIKLAYDWDWSGAEIEFRRALELNPSDSDAHYWYGYYLSFVGRFDEAVAEIRRAQELDPVSLVRITGVAQVLLMARRYDDAIEQCRTALEMDPNLGFAHWLLGLAYMYKGMYEPAILALQKSIPLSGGSPDEAASLAHAYVLSGKRGEALKILEALKQQSKRKYISLGTLADLYGVLGERDQAFALLDKAYEERDNMMVLLKVEPLFDPLRSDRRFADLLRRVGFP